MSGADGPWDAEALLAEARDATGLEDFGPPDFREGLEVLLETYATTARLSEKGARRTRRRLLQLLGTRLRVEAAKRRHPEIQERAIRQPLYLTGLPRTGTSALFNLLAEDPAARPLLLWEGIFPDPLEDLPPGRPDPRYEAIKAHYDRGRAKNPEFTKIHYASADTPEECVMLLAHTFRDVQLGIEPLMEPYGSWFQRQDLRPAYAYYAHLLRMLDWQRPGERWLLKSPAHLWALDVLVERFPDACIVLTHRDPRACIGSYCSMIEALMATREGVDPREIGPVVLEYLARSLERGLEARGRSDPGRFLDVAYDELVADPMATVRCIYGGFGLPLPEATEAAMQRHVRENPRGRHGVHEYGLEAYGLTPGRVLDRLGFYVDRFAIPTD
ncbi:MAG: sulfotransferase [Myxococcota bacterium]|nr:sulfotransferase [Myxococcota bacterium]